MWPSRRSAPRWRPRMVRGRAERDRDMRPPIVPAVLGRAGEAAYGSGAGLLPEALPDEGHDLLQRRAGGEDLGHAHLLQPGDVLVRDDPAAEDDDVPGVALREQA